MIQKVKTQLNKFVAGATTLATKRAVLWTVLALALGLFIISQLSKPNPSADSQPLNLPTAAVSTATPRTPAKSNQSNTHLPGTWYSVTVKLGDNMATIFKQLNLSQQQLLAIIHLGKPANPLRTISPGQKIHFKITADNKLSVLTFSLSPTEIYTITAKNGQYQVKIKHLPVETRTAYAQATIKQSLAQAAQKSNVPYALVIQLANIFGWEINFARQVQPGDQFRIAYQEYFVNGKKIRDGDIISAQFVNQGKTYTAIRYKTTKGYSGYYNLAGKNLNRPFLRYPVKYTRISSYFSNGRKHPILHRLRAHKGVDYAAPRGTPIAAAGSGTVAHLGRKGGYGKTIIIKHNNRYQTLYAHMARYKKGLKRGAKVKQGQVIGYVGSTGLATGPHLHYEFHVNGVHKNPLKVKLPSGRPLPQADLASFKTKAKTLLANLDTYQQTVLAKQ